MGIENDLAKFLLENNLTISTAESCTGGLLSSRLTDVSGSSNFVKLNVVTYANEIKESILGVTPKTLNTYGAVSEQCAREMVLGLKKLTNTDICVATTGIAGPTGGSDEKPVGLCYIGLLIKDKLTIKKIQLSKTAPRTTIKNLFATSALELIFKSLK